MLPSRLTGRIGPDISNCTIKDIHGLEVVYWTDAILDLRMI